MPMLSPGGGDTSEITALLQQLTGQPSAPQQPDFAPPPPRMGLLSNGLPSLLAQYPGAGAMQTGGTLSAPPMPQVAGPTAGLLAPPMNPATAASLLNALPNDSGSPSMIGRIGQHLLAIPHFLAAHAGPRVPPEYLPLIQAGILTPQEVDAARPGFLDSIAGDAAQHPGGPEGAFRDTLAGIVAAKQGVTTIQKQHHLDDIRAAAQAMFEAPPNETSAEFDDRMKRYSGFLMQHGDIEYANKAANMVKDLTREFRPRVPVREPHVMGDPNGPNAGVPVTRMLDPDSGAVLSETPEYVRPLRSSSTADMGLVHEITTVRAQIDDTNRALNAARTLAGKAGLLADPETKQRSAQAAAAIPGLQTRLDSLVQVHDRLAARQQAQGGDSPPPSTAPRVSGLNPTDAAAMQAEFNAASQVLRGILSHPNATPAQKAQARQLYDQAQTQIARKYSQRAKQQQQ